MFDIETHLRPCFVVYMLSLFIREEKIMRVRTVNVAVQPFFIRSIKPKVDAWLLSELAFAAAKRAPRPPFFLGLFLLPPIPVLVLALALEARPVAGIPPLRDVETPILFGFSFGRGNLVFLLQVAHVYTISLSPSVTFLPVLFFFFPFARASIFGAGASNMEPHAPQT